MKKIAILVLLSYTLFAQSLMQKMPLNLKNKICKQLAYNTNRCENGSTLDYYTHLSLNNGNLLLFVYLNEHMRSYAQLRDAIPIIITSKGKWLSTFGDNMISEDIQSIHQDPYNGIWVQALWQIEGVSPAYYHSKNGLRWKRIVLPQNRNVDCCFESVDAPAFSLNTVSLRFHDLDNKVQKIWTANYQSATSKKPKWQAIAAMPINGISNISKPVIWKLSKTNNSINFLNNLTLKGISLPYEDPSKAIIYSIQVGAFKQVSSLRVVRSKLKNIAYPTFEKADRGYTKLLIGQFTSYKKAKFILDKLKRKYRQNKYIQNTFILTSTP